MNQLRDISRAMAVQLPSQAKTQKPSTLQMPLRNTKTSSNEGHLPTLKSSTYPQFLQIDAHGSIDILKRSSSLTYPFQPLQVPILLRVNLTTSFLRGTSQPSNVLAIPLRKPQHPKSAAQRPLSSTRMLMAMAQIAQNHLLQTRKTTQHQYPAPSPRPKSGKRPRLEDLGKRTSWAVKRLRD